jgi:hypothetical protein
MALTTSDWIGRAMMGRVPWNRCCYCGSETSAGRFDYIGRYRCDGCRQRHDANAEVIRLAALAREVREREAMWCLPPA